jgi:peroxiredoxin
VQVLAVSSDDVDTLKKFRAQFAPKLIFAADPSGALLERYGVKTPLLTFAVRTTFVIDGRRRITAVYTGGDAIEASRSLENACTPPEPPLSSEPVPSIP